MYCQSLRLLNFRNYRQAEFKFSPRLNVLVGENGRGKTNIVESIYTALAGESFRFADNSSLILHGEKEARIDLRLMRESLDYHLRVEILKSRKRHFVNGKVVSSADLRRLFGVVLFSPESLNSIKEGADHRRSLIDDLLVVFEKRNSELISLFRRALKSRNRILKNYVEGLESRPQTIQLVESINPQYFNLARDLTSARIRAINAILPDFNEAMKAISRASDVEISVEYVVSGENHLKSTSETMLNTMLNRAQELSDAELSAGTSLVGPHKHDIVFLYNQKDSRIFCSQGQQRAVILAFKIAQIVYHRKVHGVYPLLLLDDVLSELDKGKREALISFLHEINTQTFITTTDFTLPQSFSFTEGDGESSGEMNVIKMNESGF